MLARHLAIAPLAAMLLAGAAIASPPRSATPQRTEPVPVGAAAWPEHLTRAIRGGEASIVLADVDLGGGLRASLELERASAIDDSVRVVASRFVRSGRGGRLESRDLPAPDLAVRRGVAKDADGNTLGEAWIAAGRKVLGGFVRLEDGVRFIASGPHGADRPPLVFDPASVAASLLPSGEAFCEVLEPGPAGGAGSSEGGVAGVVVQCYELAVAVETDLEFTTSLFGGDLEAASEYAIALLAASSEIFDLDLSVRFRMSFLRLWEDEDPWDQSGTGAQLGQFRDHWQALMSDVPRDLAHFFSGRGLGGGVAWLPGICGSYGYALSANLGGSFPYPLEDHRHENWDIMVVTHEFGHNVGSPHTHSVSPPLDGCGNGDCSQAYGGTIMSYCHTCPGGLSNIVLRFHPGSIDSMLAALANASCDYSGGPEPVADPDSATGFADAPVEIDVLRNDRGGDCSEISLASHAPTTAAGHAVDTFVGDDGRTWIVVVPDGDASGSDAFTYEIVDSFGNTAQGDVSIDWMTARPATLVTGTSPGVVAKHYEIPESSVLPDFSTLVPVASETLDRIELPSTGGAFAGSGRADLVASAFTGWLEVPQSAVWTLYTESDDGSKLWIGDSLVVDNDGLHGMVEKSGTIALAAGRHPIRVEFFENFGGAGLIVRWAADGVAKTVVPSAAWSHGGAVVSPDLDGDGLVGGGDLAIMLASWGSCGGCPADLDGDGAVGGGDLASLLAAWQVP